jgi:uncharacterized membrane protein
MVGEGDPSVGREEGLSVAVLVAVVLAFIALSRSGARGDLARRLKKLEDELAEVRRILAAGGGAAAAPPTGAVETTSEALPFAAGAEALPEPAESPVLAPISPRPEQPPETAQAAVDEPSTGEPSTGRPSAHRPVANAAPAARGLAWSGIDWERWLGVRGAAVLGGAALALAGLLFFRYSIEHGLIPPWLRVVVGTLTGVAAIVAAEWSLRSRYAGTANALAGGGLVVLYAAFWAAGVLYELVSPGALFLLMIAVTVTGCALSWRHDSLVIAVIGLVGGFLTPLFASTGNDRPIGLFGYILLLDAGLLLVAQRKRWPVLAVLALGGTALYEALWVGVKMGPTQTTLGLAILALFALVFALAAPASATVAGARLWRWSQRGGVLLPFALAVHFAARAELEVGIVRLGGLLALLGLAAGWLARRHGEARLALGTAAATLAVVIAWAVQHPELGGTPWAASAVAAVLAGMHHVAVELAHRDRIGQRATPAAQPAGEEAAAADREAPAVAESGRGVFRSLADAATLVGVGLLAVLVASAASDELSIWPLLAGWLAIAAVLVRQGTFAGRGRVQLLAAVAVAIGLAVYRLAHPAIAASPSVIASPATLLALMLVCAILWQGIAIMQAHRPSAAQGEHAAAALALVLLLSLLSDPPPTATAGLAASFGLGLLVALVGTRLGGGPWLLVATLATALVQLGWTMSFRPRTSAVALGLAALSSIAFTAWPLGVAARLRGDRWAWRAAALAGPAWFPALLLLFEDLYGDRVIAVLPLALGAVSVAAAARARGTLLDDGPERTSALAWLCGAALGLLTVAIPLQLEKEWLTIGWALEGAALLALWVRLDHPGLKYTALALLGAVAVRLIGNPEVLAYHPRGAWRVANWLAYTYLVPAAALAYSSRLLDRFELARIRDWERPLYVRVQPIAAGASGLAALLVVFVWINLAIADWYSAGANLRLMAARAPAEKLTISIAWAVYAIGILALGVRVSSGALRWASLVLLMGTIGKIFLYDLGELRDLYRVGALLGLAISLIVVSLVYQRFVFRRPAETGAP